MKAKRLKLLVFVMAIFAFTLVACENTPPQDDPILEQEEVQEEIQEHSESEEQDQNQSQIERGEVEVSVEDITLAVQEQLAPPTEGEDIVIMKTNMGEIKIKFFPEEAPKAVENFLTHAKNGYYDGITFHRVINDFMLQTGDPTATGRGGESIWGANFEDEFSLKRNHFRGALSMANPNRPDSNSSQFFIVQAKEAHDSFLDFMSGDENLAPIAQKYAKVGGTPHLDFTLARPQSNGHSVFGQVYEGMDVVDMIANVEVDAYDKPLEDVIIESIEVTVG